MVEGQQVPTRGASRAKYLIVQVHEHKGMENAPLNCRHARDLADEWSAWTWWAQGSFLRELELQSFLKLDS